MAGIIDELESAAKLASNAVRKGPDLINATNSYRLNRKSIAKGAKDATFQFPCLVVDSAPIDMANTVARTLDQVYATFAQTWLSMNSMFDITIDPTPLSYLRKLHQNLKLEGVDISNLEVDEEDMGRYMEKVYDGSYRLYLNEEKDFGLLINKSDYVTKGVVESHKDALREYLSDFDLRPFEVTEALTDSTSKYDMANSLIQNSLDKRAVDLAKDISNITGKDRKESKILPRDLKRSNDMMPYGLQIQLIALNDKKEFVQYIDAVIGIKTILHVVPSTEMMENIIRSLQNKSILFKALKWTTGEISLFKDIILNLTDIKNNVGNKYDKHKSPFFTTLSRLKDKKLGFRNLTVPTGVIPNTSIILTSYEVDYLNDNYSIDLRSNSVAKRLLSSLFLMAIIILDEGTNTVQFFYDGDETYQTYALETLERDNDMNSNKLGKEIGRMIAH